MKNLTQCAFILLLLASHLAYGVAHGKLTAEERKELQAQLDADRKEKQAREEAERAERKVHAEKEAAEKNQAKNAKVQAAFQADVAKLSQEYQEKMKSYPADFTAACSVFEDYKDNGDGTLTDPRSGLIWQKCALGQTWDGSACRGEALKMDWIAAMLAAKSDKFLGMADWRLPTSTELRSVIRMKSDCQKQLDIHQSETDAYLKGLENIIRTHFNNNTWNTTNAANELSKLQTFKEGVLEKRKEREKVIKLKNVSEKLGSNIGDGSQGGFWSITPEGDTGYTPIIGSSDAELIPIISSNCGGSSVVAGFEYGSMFSLPRYSACSSTLPNTRLVRAGKLLEGEGIAEFEREYQRAAKAQAEIKTLVKKREKALKALGESAKNERLAEEKMKRDYAAKTEIFRKNLQPGDKAVQGLVLAVNGKLIKIEATEYLCTKRYTHNNSCAGSEWITSEKWVQRSELLPR